MQLMLSTLMSVTLGPAQYVTEMHSWESKFIVVLVNLSQKDPAEHRSLKILHLPTDFLDFSLKAMS